MDFRRRMRIVTWFLGFVAVLLLLDALLLVLSGQPRYALANVLFVFVNLTYMYAVRTSIGLEAVHDEQCQRIAAMAAAARDRALNGQPYETVEFIDAITAVANPTGVFDDVEPTSPDLPDPRSRG